MNVPDTLFTFEALMTLGGAAYLTYLIVAYTKSLIDKCLHIPTDLYAVLVGSIVLFLAQVGTGASALDWKVWALSVANGFLVAATAGQSNNVALKPPGKNQE
jgi:hypothetical protein